MCRTILDVRERSIPVRVQESARENHDTQIRMTPVSRRSRELGRESNIWRDTERNPAYSWVCGRAREPYREAHSRSTTLHQLLVAAGVTRQHFDCQVAEDGLTTSVSSDVLVSEPTVAQVIEFLKSYRWLHDEMPAAIVRQREYLEGKAGPTGITGWQVIAFQSSTHRWPNHESRGFI